MNVPVPTIHVPERHNIRSLTERIEPFAEAIKTLVGREASVQVDGDDLAGGRESYRELPISQAPECPSSAVAHNNAPGVSLNLDIGCAALKCIRPGLDELGLVRLEIAGLPAAEAYGSMG